MNHRTTVFALAALLLAASAWAHHNMSALFDFKDRVTLTGTLTKMDWRNPHISVYVDAKTSDIRDWYVSRFLRLRETAFRDPQSYFARYASLSRDEAVAEAKRIWDSINGPNLSENVLPTRSRATLVLRKAADHSVRYVRLRKI